MRSSTSLLLHPVAVLAVATLLVNDHVLKERWTSWATGKLSDAAGLAFFPLLVFVLAATMLPRETKRHPRAALAGCTAATVLAFVLVKTMPAATHAYAIALGAIQWPFHAMGALAEHAAAPPIVAVVAVTDSTDLLALPFALVPMKLLGSESVTAAPDRCPERARAHGEDEPSLRGARRPDRSAPSDR